MLSPLSLRPGQTQDIALRGAALAGATDLWTSFQAKAVLTPKPNNGKNASEVSFRISLPADTPSGIYGLRVATDQGISPLRLMLVDDLSVVAQQAGNTMPATAQHVSVPAAIDGALDPLSNHFYKFHVEAGQRLSMEILARRIGSALDPTLRLFDAKGREIAYCDDLPGLSEDAAIDHTFSKAGDYVLAVEDNLNQGGGNYYYHLRIGDFPAAVVALPLGATRGSQQTFHFADKPGSQIEALLVRVPTDPQLVAINVPARFVGGSSRSFATVVLSDRRESNEVEPNDDRKTATRVEFGQDLNGRLQKLGDVDHFVFHAKSGQSARFTAFARRLGSPADVVLRVTQPDGNQLAYVEGAAANEATLTTSFSKDGDYLLEVADLNHRGGPRYAYHVDFVPSDAGFALEASAESLNIPAGGTALIKVTAARSRYIGAIAVKAVDLPKGVTSAPTMIGPGQDSVVLTLCADSTAVASRVHPIRIVGTGRVRGADFQANATISEQLTNELSGMPYPPESLAMAAAFGIAPAAPFTLRTEPAELLFGRNLSGTVKVIAKRQKGFDEEIALAIVPSEKETTPPSPPKHLLPTGITAALKPIPKGASSVEIAFSADNQPALAEFTTVLEGTLKKGNQTQTQPAPGVALKLEEPFHISVAAASGKLPRKGQLRLNVSAKRNPAFPGEITLACSQLPKGITASSAKLAAGKTEQELILSATAEAAAGAIKNVKVVAQAKVGNGNFSSKVPLAGIVVE
jgi:Bacterial pre-peptidase C-terminal domain